MIDEYSEPDPVNMIRKAYSDRYPRQIPNFDNSSFIRGIMFYCDDDVEFICKRIGELPDYMNNGEVCNWAYVKKFVENKWDARDKEVKTLTEAEIEKINRLRYDRVVYDDSKLFGRMGIDCRKLDAKMVSRYVEKIEGIEDVNFVKFLDLALDAGEISKEFYDLSVKGMKIWLNPEMLDKMDVNKKTIKEIRAELEERVPCYRGLESLENNKNREVSTETGNEEIEF